MQIVNCSLITVKGLVQGVGFRPFIYSLAFRYQLKGWVENRNDCVKIKVEGDKESIDKFIHSVKNELPPAALINSIDIEDATIENFSDFKIVSSKNVSDKVTQISPDIAVCNDCLADIKNQPLRINYPFTNCTNCGPRFTIIKDLPYDREMTTMKPFTMCNDCKAEYTNVLDRRFHAQPVACNNCGPEYELVQKDKSTKDFADILYNICKIIDGGGIIAIKGLGGFHLACDAMNEAAVKRLRILKVREGKPFAVMFSDISKVNDFAELNDEESKLIQSWKRPIVVLKEKKNIKYGLSSEVGLNLDTIGIMLPYMPIHYMFFEKIHSSAIVLTSGNISDEPIIIDNEKAVEQFIDITDGVLIYNRDIYNRTDDSVASIVNNKVNLIRRSRSYTPSPVNTALNVDGIIATGAELQNCFCVGKDNQAFLSQHIGDLKNIETYDFYKETFHKFIKLFRVKPQLVVCDLHPDYLSTKFGKSFALMDVERSRNVTSTPLSVQFVQHHHAHIASCMAEHSLDEKVIGVSFDGTGLGDDGNIWGGEFLLCDLNEYHRYQHFEYIPLPGGDKVTKEPWRSAVSYLYSIYGREFIDMNFPFLNKINKDDLELTIHAIKNGINSPLCSSAGRLFDAVSALINLCPVSLYHAEAPMKLESIADINCTDKYNYEIGSAISFKKTFVEIVNDLDNVPISVISSKFHNTIVSVIVDVAILMRKEHNINKVAISGGTFQNRFILSKVENQLTDNGFTVYTQTTVPCNDGGISLGQLVIAAKRRSLK